MADFTSRFNELLERNSGSDTDLAKVLGVSKQTISAWKTGNRSPKKPTIRTIADYFHVGIPWLNGLTDDETETGLSVIGERLGSGTPASQKLHDLGGDLFSVLHADESELLSIFRSLNDLGQQTLLGTARGLAANPDLKKDGELNNVTA